jgi:cyclic beta-1,2-glucan synthetase
MGGGDWNDGMNRIGVKGEGESVWLTWFVIRTVEDYLGVAGARVPPHVVENWRKRMAALAKAAEEYAWDGQWYRRAFDDEGDVVGASTAQECRIDSLAQSWAVISGMADPVRMDMAMRSADTLLNDYENQVARLFTPPFERGSKDPGYVKSYPPGLRENGGQYTHAALWMVMAMARLGWHNKAHELFAMLNPIAHSHNLRGADRYKTEPYVVVADVYDNTRHRGRGGWSWYTGSASWMYRVGIEEILGLRVRGNRLTVVPRIPDNWPGYDMVYRYGTTRYHLHVRRSEEFGKGISKILKCGEYLPLVDDGAEHMIGLVL